MEVIESNYNHNGGDNDNRHNDTYSLPQHNSHELIPTCCSTESSISLNKVFPDSGMQSLSPKQLQKQQQQQQQQRSQQHLILDESDVTIRGKPNTKLEAFYDSNMASSPDNNSDDENIDGNINNNNQDDYHHDGEGVKLVFNNQQDQPENEGVRNFFSKAVDGSCNQWKCEDSVAEQLRNFNCAFLSPTRTQNHQCSTECDPFNRNLVGPRSCEYCHAESTLECDPSKCERPPLFFAKKRPPFAHSAGWEKSGHKKKMEKSAKGADAGKGTRAKRGSLFRFFQ